tara:strand:+ start:4377 stop:5306 length:930 start_codon:yes stop_codon:yes gene_type:complete
MLNKKSKIFVAGHNGMVGSSICRALKNVGYKKIITIEKKKLNLLNQEKVFKFLKKIKPKLTIVAAAKVGGILVNSKEKHQFIYENLQIQNNLIHGSYLARTKNLIFLGSSCIYPKNCKQPMKEDFILSGKLEETNDAYALAKLAGIKMCENYSTYYKLNYKSFMPPNMYGPGDNYDLLTSHFFSALIKKIYLARKYNKKYIKVWGSGKPKRELLFVDDFAKAIVFFMNLKIKEPFLNIGTGKEHSIEWYVKFLLKKLNVKLAIKYDKTKPDGVKSKMLDVTKARKYGWKQKENLDHGLHLTLQDFYKNN